MATLRQGYCILNIKAVRGYNTQDVAGIVQELADYDKTTPIICDQGGNVGVLDLLNEWGYNVVPVAFGGRPNDPNVYCNCASEMMFELPLKQMYIPKELLTQELLEDLSERQYFYNSKGLKQLGRAPDTGDSVCLAFYNRRNDVCY